MAISHKTERLLQWCAASFGIAMLIAGLVFVAIQTAEEKKEIKELEEQIDQKLEWVGKYDKAMGDIENYGRVLPEGTTVEDDIAPLTDLPNE